MGDSERKGLFDNSDGGRAVRTVFGFSSMSETASFGGAFGAGGSAGAARLFFFRRGLGRRGAGGSPAWRSAPVSWR